jgi:hypothetical protein
MRADKVERDRNRLTKICLGFPEVQVSGDQHIVFSVRDKKFAYHLVDHHGDGRAALQCKAARRENAALVAEDPIRFFMPPYMAHHGWIGLYFDVGTVDWDEVEELVIEAYLLVAPKSLAKQLGSVLQGRGGIS